MCLAWPFTKAGLDYFKVLLITAIFTVAAGFLYKRYEGPYCLVGQSEGTVSAQSAAQCMFQCERTQMCTSFTYFSTNWTCDLKHPVSRQKLIASPTNVPGCMFLYKVSPINICSCTYLKKFQYFTKIINNMYMYSGYVLIGPLKPKTKLKFPKLSFFLILKS